MIKKGFDKQGIIIVIFLCFISRMPQLLSQNLILDGDESILGLMAKHFLELKDVPLYFYGQSYGFSFIEVLFTRLFYALFGITDCAVKLAMLSLWTIGIVFFYKALKALKIKNNPWIPLLITLVFIFSPSFAVWSMKARGGYLTAFTLSSILLFLVLKTKEHLTLLRSFMMGVLLIFIYQAQPLWLAGIFPFIVYYFYKNLNVKTILSTCSGCGIGIVVFYFIKLGLPTFWQPAVLGKPDFSFASFLSVFDRMFVYFTGNYTYGKMGMHSIFGTKVLSILMIILLFISIGTGVFYLVKRKKGNLLLYASLFSVLSTLGYLFFIHNTAYRYLLPLTGFALLLIALVLKQIKWRKWVNFFLVIWIGFGAYSLYCFKDYSFENKSALVALVHKLENNKVNYIYCEGGLLQWQIMFYSKEKVIARYYYNTDRYPAYIKTVNTAFKNNRKQTALVGFLDEKKELAPAHLTPIKHQYFIYYPIDKALLKKRGFKLPKDF